MVAALWLHSVEQILMSKLTNMTNVSYSPPVRRAGANVVSIIAKYAVPAGEWPDLLPFLFQCSQSPQEDHREVIMPRIIFFIYFMNIVRFGFPLFFSLLHIIFM